MSEPKFTTDYNLILEKVAEINPVEYAKTRNFIDGAVSHLSPYISRGVISLKQVKQEASNKGLEPYQIEKFLQELAWREYYQRIWQVRGDAIWNDLRQPQPDVLHNKMVKAVVEARTNITAIDAGINKLYESGYMHNHVRMYVASIVCNIGKAYWLQPSKWLYYNLLDGDVASNNASWQWVAAAFSDKKYYFNQENLNKYTGSDQRNTFMDKSYEDVATMEIPDVLLETIDLKLETILPETEKPTIDTSKPTIIYNSYNLDPQWRKDEDANRILLLEPSHFSKYPVSERVIQFVIDLSKNIPGIQVFVGEISELVTFYDGSELNIEKAIISKNHVAFKHYPGIKDDYEWMFPEVTGEYSSFFKYWKRCKAYL
ncbi:FAD-binding domain-containing protein [Pedobacter jejuensis]|uniref:Deoxyribodipyrimidine photolyase n=1 Tax=Pedobacter jejuensis TaxID=1268550 RepID=A0A3N0BUF3_9SPHI|nr:FAD-binding domain-containing protein [Pedobacter jejuensis]RNL52510.1 deoxyribodipyrimidine photolyase [Pedobacter jejuensis]